MYTKFKKEILERHDVYCNQKYEERNGFVELPYSFHLLATEQIAIKYSNIVFGEEYLSTLAIKDVAENQSHNTPTVLTYIKCVAVAHDCMEDARLTYNDLFAILHKNFKGFDHFCMAVVNSVYRLTDNKGKNSSERKNDLFFAELSEDVVAMYIKLCDRLANISYGNLMGSGMLTKYRNENYRFMKNFKLIEFKPLIEDISNQLIEN